MMCSLSAPGGRRLVISINSFSIFNDAFISGSLGFICVNVCIFFYLWVEQPPVVIEILFCCFTDTISAAIMEFYCGDRVSEACAILHLKAAAWHWA